MAERIEALILDNKLLEVMGRKSQERAIKEFSDSRMANEYAKLYREIQDK